MFAAESLRDSSHRNLISLVALLTLATSVIGGTARAADPPDTVPPVVTIESPSPDQFVSSPRLTVSGTADDDIGLAEVRAYVDGDPLSRTGLDTPFDIEVDITDLAEGEHTARVSAFDFAGNRGDSEVRRFTIDRTIPALSKVGGPERGAVVKTRRVRFLYSLGNEPSTTRLSCSVDGVPLPGDCPLDLEVELDDGEHTVAAFAIDRAGNRTVIATTFTVSVPDDPEPSCETDPRLCPEPPIDSIAPIVEITRLSQKSGSLKQGLKLKVKGSEACSGSVKAKSPGGLAFRGAFQLKAAGQTKLVAKPTPATRTRLLRRNSPVRLEVTAIAVDPSGNRSTAVRKLRIRP